MFRSALEKLFRWIFPASPTAVAAAARDPHGGLSGPPLGGARGRLVVVSRAGKLMRPARVARDGRRIPAVIVPHLICTHRSAGKPWPTDHSTSAMRRLAR